MGISEFGRSSTCVGRKRHRPRAPFPVSVSHLTIEDSNILCEPLSGDKHSSPRVLVRMYSISALFVFLFLKDFSRPVSVPYLPDGRVALYKEGFLGEKNSKKCTHFYSECFFRYHVVNLYVFLRSIAVLPLHPMQEDPLDHAKCCLYKLIRSVPCCSIRFL